MKKIVAWVSAFVVLLALGVGAYLGLQKPEYLDPVVAENSARLKLSLKVINQGMNQDPNVLYRAMVSIGQQADAKTAEKIRAFAESKEKMVRAGVAFVMVYQKDPKSQELLKHLAHDPEPLVRAHIVHAIHQHPAPDHEEILKELIENENLTDMERIQAKSVLYLSLQDRDEASEVLESLTDEVRFNTTDTRNTDQLFLQLNEIAPPGNRKLIALDQKALTLSKNPAVVASAIRFLANTDNTSFISGYSKWIHSTDPAIKRAAIETLHLTCPDKRWTWIREGFGQESDFSNKSLWILATERLNGEEAIKILTSALEQAKKTTPTKANEVLALESSLRRTLGSKEPHPCDD